MRAHVLIEADRHADEALCVEIAGLPELRRLARVTGIYSLIAELEASSPERLDAALDALGRMKGVQRTTSAVELSLKLSR